MGALPAALSCVTSAESADSSIQQRQQTATNRQLPIDSKQQHQQTAAPAEKQSQQTAVLGAVACAASSEISVLRSSTVTLFGNFRHLCAPAPAAPLNSVCVATASRNTTYLSVRVSSGKVVWKNLVLAGKKKAGPLPPEQWPVELPISGLIEFDTKPVAAKTGEPDFHCIPASILHLQVCNDRDLDTRPCSAVQASKVTQQVAKPRDQL